MFVLDESDESRNPNTNLFSASMHAGASASAWLCLSGTPYQNKPADCVSQLRICHGRPEFTCAGAFTGRKCRSEYLERLHSSSLIRAREAMDLPPLTERAVRLALPPEERARLAGLLAGAVEHMERFEAAHVSFVDILKGFTAIRRLSAGCTVLRGGGGGGAEEEEPLVQGRGAPDLSGPDSAKVLEAARRATAHMTSGSDGGGSKVLIFCSFLEPLFRLQRALGARSELYHGSMSPAERAAAKGRFDANPQPCALLVSLSAGGKGLNLQSASVAIHMDKWWNPAITEQATHRIWRLGQTQACTVEHLEYEDSFDDVCAQFFHAPKKRSAQTLLAGSYARATTVSLDASCACSLLEEIARRQELPLLSERIAAVRRRMRAEGVLRLAGASEAEVAEARRARQARAAARLAAARTKALSKTQAREEARAAQERKKAAREQKRVAQEQARRAEAAEVLALRKREAAAMDPERAWAADAQPLKRSRHAVK